MEVAEEGCFEVSFELPKKTEEVSLEVSVLREKIIVISEETSVF